MSRDTALAAARDLRTALLDHGVARVSIELQAGRGPAADPWHARTFLGMLSHHIASRPSQGLTPGLALVKQGRAGLPGPLCNAYGGYDLTARIICLGWANHPGEGGPWTLPAGTIPADNGRPYLLGWEFEGGYEPYTDEMSGFMARCGAGTLAWLGQPVAAHGEHKTWAPGRKVDRLGYDTNRGRAEITAVLSEEDDMPTAQEIAEAVWAHNVPNPATRKAATAATRLGEAAVHAYAARVGVAAIAPVNVEAIAEAIANRLPASGVSATELARAILDELANPKET